MENKVNLQMAIELVNTLSSCSYHRISQVIAELKRNQDSFKDRLDKREFFIYDNFFNFPARCMDDKILFLSIVGRLLSDEAKSKLKEVIMYYYLSRLLQTAIDLNDTETILKFMNLILDQ